MTLVWRSSGFTPRSPVHVIGSVAVVYGSVGDQLFLFGLDETSGVTRWQVPASGSSIAPAVTLDVTTIGGRVVFYGATSAATENVARMQALDPGTGVIVASSSPQRWVSAPVSCDSAQVTACAGTEVGAGGWSAFVVDLRTGRTTLTQGVRPFRQVGDELVDSLARSPEQLSRLVNGRAVWTVPLADAFGATATSDDGWDFQTFAGAGVVVGTVLRTVGVDAAYGSSLDLTTAPSTAAVSLATGATVWHQSGVSVDCLGAVRSSAPDGANAPIRCRYTGGMSVDPTGDIGVTADYTVALEGYDPATGATIWTADFGNDFALVHSDNPLPLLQDDQAVVTTRRGDRVWVDLRTGAQQPASDSAIYWCHSNTAYQQSPRPTTAVDVPNDRLGSVEYPCQPSGLQVSRYPSAVPSALGERVGNAVLIATSDGVVALTGR